MTDTFMYAFGWYIAGFVSPFAIAVLIGIFYPDKWTLY